MKAAKSRRSLLAFTEYTNSTYYPAGHHYRIAEKLEAVERGEIDRLMVFMPPRHGKSELASRRWPAWCLGRNPKRQIIGASYNSELAEDFGRAVRNIVASDEFRDIFRGVSLAEDSGAAKRFSTSHGGTYIAAGVGTAVTGRGADIGLIDDPFKDRAEADSETIRERVWDWYRSTFYTRLMPGASIVLIQTRWHEDDLAGRLLNSSADRWEVLELPAIDGEGKALWPEWYDVPALERIKATIGPREWSALYQQSPQPDDGTFFQRQWFDLYTKLPDNLNKYGTSDYATKEDEGDFTEHAVWGVDPSGDVWLVDGWSGQTAADKWIEHKLDLVRRHKPFAWFGESGVIKNVMEPMLRRRMRERSVFCRLEWLPSVHDKPSRARAFQAMAASGRVHIPDTDYGQRVLAQMLSFPAGKNDDFVDAASLIGRAIADAHPAIVGAPKVVKPVDRWDIEEREDANWKAA